MKNIIKFMMMGALALLPMTAMADQRISVIATAPVPLSTATTTNSGLGFSYAAIKIGPRMEISPFVTAQNLKSPQGVNGIHVAPGIMGNLHLWNRVDVGIGEVLKPGAKLNLNPDNYTPTLVVGIRL